MDLRLILSLLVLTLFFGKLTLSLECYSCSATLGNQFKCENLSFYGGSIPYHTCFYADAVCAKYVIDYGDAVMIHRSCHHRNVCAMLGQRYNSFYSSLLECITCHDRDYCNAADLPTIGATLIGSALILIKSI